MPRPSAARLLPPTAFFAYLLLSSLPGRAEEHLVDEQAFGRIAAEYSGERALESVRQIVAHHRIQGSPMMAGAAREVAAALRAAGLGARIETFPSDGRRRYGGHVSPMGWRMRGGELWVEQAPGLGAPLRLCRYADVPMCVSTYSRGGTFAGELVEVGRGTSAADYAGKDVRGKVALAHGYAASVVREAVLQRGAVGVVIYPAATDRPDHPDMVRYNGIWPLAEDLARTAAGFQISANQYVRLSQMMRKGPVRVRGSVDADLGPGEMTVVHAYLRGTAEPDREVLITAHLDHPKWSANDNASGAGATVEMARALYALYRDRRLPPPRRTLHFMWVPEFYGTYAWVMAHKDARRCGPWDDPRPGQRPFRLGGPCVVANLNLDMVGEDTVKTGSRLYMTRSPGSVPSFLDALLKDVLAQVRARDLTAQAGTRNLFVAESIPYGQGSDHDVLLGLGVPATMLGHAPDWTHHTSEDTLDKVDATTLLRVGVLASAAASWLASADEAGAARLLARTLADRLSFRAERLARILSAGTPAPYAPLVAPLQQGVADDLQRLAGLRATARLSGPFPESLLLYLSPPETLTGPRRQVLLPLPDDVLRGLPAQDQAWVRQQDDDPAYERGAPAPPFDLLAYEAANWLGRGRTPAQVAALLSAEFLAPVDAAWVERLWGILLAKGAAR